MADRPEWGINARAKVALAAVTALATAAGVSVAFASDPAVSTVAGNGSGGSSGDGAAATLAQIEGPEDISFLPAGGFLVADTQSDRIRQVAPDGTITTVAGTGQGGALGDGGPADLAELRSPGGVAALPAGGFLIADTENDRIREVAPDGTIETVAGPAQLDEPRAVAPLAGGGFLIADTEGHVISKVDALGTKTVVAGTGIEGYTGDGGPALNADLDGPYDVAPLLGGGFLFSDHDQQVVRKVDPFGTITTVAGGGISDAEGIPATSAKLDSPAGIAPLATGGFLVAGEVDHSVRWVSAGGVIKTVAGTGNQGFSGDLGHPLAAQFDSPMGISASPMGDDLLLADTKNNRVRAIALSLPDDGPPEGDDDPPPPTNDASPEAEKRGSAGDTRPPVLGKAVTVAATKGTVRVRRPRSRRFVVLAGAAQVPVGSILDVRRGTVALSSALDRKGNTQTAHFWSGVFQVRQARTGRGMTDIILRGAKRRCRAAGSSRKAGISAKRKRPRGRRLWAKDKRGRFRTRGSKSVATTRGTYWLTEERCTGTLTKVVEGAVVVRNLSTGKRVTVRAGKRYLARRKR